MKESDLLNLSKRLTEDFSWPSVYMFKIIFPIDNRTYALVRRLFGDEARFFEKTSSGGKFISVTVKEMMLSADEVIARYRQLLSIEKVMLL